jgi:hypothetical protein
MKYSAHQPQYIPWLGFFDKIDKSDCFVYLDDVQYKHREFQNRNQIRTKDGLMWLTVPVLYHQGEKVRDVRIDNAQDWRSDHLKSLRAWYGKAGFFKKYFSFFEGVYKKDWAKLIDINVAVIEFVLKELKVEKKMYFETGLAAGGEKTERIISIGKKLKAQVYLSGAGAKEYLEEGRFAEEGIKLEYQDFSHPVYKQQFMKTEGDFVSRLSILDLLFNEGERSVEILRRG